MGGKRGEGGESRCQASLTGGGKSVRRAFVSPADHSCSRRDPHLVHITHHVYSSKAALCQRAQELPFR